MTSVEATVPPLQAYDYMLIVLPFACYWGTCVIFGTGRYLNLLDQFEIQKGGYDDPSKQKVSRTRVVVTVMAQHCVAMTLSMWITSLDGSCVARELPGWESILPQVVAGMLIMDTWLYWMHRWMHVNKWLYHNVHSWHHRIYASYCYAAQFNHPVEGFLLDTLSGALAMFLLDLHPLVACGLFCFANIKNVDDHCGFRLRLDPFQYFFQNNADFHDSHHRMQGLRFNYSQPFFSFWDHIGGTYKEPKTIRVD